MKIRREKQQLFKGLANFLPSKYPIENFKQDTKLGPKTEKLLKEFAQNAIINGGGTFLCYDDGTNVEVHINDKVAETLFEYAADVVGPIYFDKTNAKDYNSLVNAAMRCVVLSNGRAKDIISAAEDAGIDGGENLKELIIAIIKTEDKGTYFHLPQFMKNMISNIISEAKTFLSTEQKIDIERYKNLGK